MTALIKFQQEGSDFSVVIDDDGKVAYAYLMNKTGIVGDVWLYNCGPAPMKPEWTDPTKAPFANPKSYISEKPFAPVTNDADFEVQWSAPGRSPQTVRILIRNKLHAWLTVGSRPGWCRLAKRDGPLALVLSG